MSLRNIAAKGIRNARCFLPMYAPPNKAMAAIGVKFGQWGIKRKKAPAMITDVTKIKFACIFLLFMFSLFISKLQI